MPARRRKKPEQKPVPTFETEAREREFWETHDTVGYVDWRRGRLATFPDLKPSTTTISLRLPAPLLAELKVLANKRDVPYQSLLKVFLAERLATEHDAIAGLANKRPKRTDGTRRRKALRASGSAGR
jgi:predicted DNA binding CopG/RHH family protein